MKPTDLYPAPPRATNEQLTQYWAEAPVSERKLYINIAFLNSKGSEESVNAFLEMVGEKYKDVYLDHYKSLVAAKAKGQW